MIGMSQTQAILLILIILTSIADYGSAGRVLFLRL